MRRALALLAASATAALAAGDASAAALRVEARMLSVETPRYRLELSRRHGGLVRLVDRRSGATLLRGSRECAWLALDGDRPHARGCSYSPAGRARFSWSWAPRTSTLTLRYRGGPRVEATVTMRFAAAWVEQRLTLTSRTPAVVSQVAFPVDLVGDARAVRAGHAPNFLPGIRFGPAFFARTGNNLRTYPSRWAFADLLALELRGGSVALGAANPPPAAIAPVTLGFVRDPAGPCSGAAFCVRHVFQTWLRRGETWRSPPVRLRVGATPREAALAYRRENGIDRFLPVAAKAPLAALAPAPLVKADPWKHGVPFREWGAALRRLPSPSLLHPVAIQPGGHDVGFPDVLPPDPRWGTLDELRAALADGRSLGHLAMPYLNASWWDGGSATLLALGTGGAGALAVRDEAGAPVSERYGDREGWVVSPHAGPVQERLRGLLGEWQAGLGAQCTFLDQLGARPWLRDLNPAAPTPLAYHDGWVAAIAPYARRCLMVEDGWDRLAASAAGFHGSALMLHREHDELDRLWGRGAWEPSPLALWILRDKVLLYQHDLYPGTMAADLEVLLWNTSFGYQLSYDWSGGSLASPWLDVVADVQRALGPLHAGVPLAAWSRSGAVSESRFGTLSVTGNWDAESTLPRGGVELAPHGFHARTADGAVVAGAYEGRFGGGALAPGVHVLVVERRGDAVEVRHSLGVDTTVAVAVPWARVRVTALARDGRVLEERTAASSGGRVVVDWRRAAGGGETRAYRLTPAG